MACARWVDMIAISHKSRIQIDSLSDFLTSPSCLWHLRYVLLLILSVISFPKDIFAQQIFDTSATYQQEGKWTQKREALHRQIVANLLTGLRAEHDPKVIFTGGPSGAGKSTVLKELATIGLFPTNNTVFIDPDMVKELLPEYTQFKKLDPQKAASAVHSESGYICDVLYAEAIKRGFNIVVDGTLRAYDYFYKVITEIPAIYGKYQIVTVYVDASLPTLMKRVEERGKKTRRYVPTDIVQQTKLAMDESYNTLLMASDFTYYIENESEPIPRKGFSIMSGLREIPLNFPLDIFRSEEALKEFLKSSVATEDIRFGISFFLGGMPGNGKYQIKLLKLLLQDSSEKVREGAIWAIKKIQLFNSLKPEEIPQSVLETDLARDENLEQILRNTRALVTSHSWNERSVRTLADIVVAMIKKTFPGSPVPILISKILSEAESALISIPKSVDPVDYNRLVEGLRVYKEFYPQIVPMQCRELFLF